MRFPIVFTVLACGVMALAAAVAPDALVSRSDSGISKVISTLDKTLNILLPKLGSSFSPFHWAIVRAGC